MKRFLHVLVLLSLAACATQRFDLQASADSSAAQLDDSQVFWVGGIGQQKEVDAAQACGSADKVARVETLETPTNLILRAITFSIYAPRQIRVYCKA